MSLSELMITIGFLCDLYETSHSRPSHFVLGPGPGGGGECTVAAGNSAPGSKGQYYYIYE